MTEFMKRHVLPLKGVVITGETPPDTLPKDDTISKGGCTDKQDRYTEGTGVKDIHRQQEQGKVYRKY